MNEVQREFDELVEAIRALAAADEAHATTSAWAW